MKKHTATPRHTVSSPSSIKPVAVLPTSLGAVNSHVTVRPRAPSVHTCPRADGHPVHCSSILSACQRSLPPATRGRGPASVRVRVYVCSFCMVCVVCMCMRMRMRMTCPGANGLLDGITNTRVCACMHTRTCTSGSSIVKCLLTLKVSTISGIGRVYIICKGCKGTQGCVKVREGV